MSTSDLSSFRPLLNFGRRSRIQSTEAASANVLSPLSLDARSPVRPAFAAPPPAPAPTVTYHSNQLGLFDGGTEDPLFSAASPKFADAFPHLAPNKSSAPASASNNPPPKKRLRVQDYERVGGWMKDELGRDQYIETGRIEEVGDDYDDDSDGAGIIQRLEHTPLPITATPPPRPILPVHDFLPGTPTAFSIPDMSSSFNLGRIMSIGSAPLLSIQESMSPVADVVSSTFTPPPPPRCPPAGSDTETRPPSIPRKSETENIAPALAHSDESMVEANLLTIEGLSAEVEVIRTSFTAMSSQQDVRRHIEMCTRIEESLFRVQNVLIRRRGLPEEHWDFFSTFSRSKYEERLYSLQRCLRRLGAMSRRKIHLESSKLGDVLKKLEEHYQKLSDVADKLDATFDRLKLRYLYTTASKLTEEANHSRSIYLAARELYLHRSSEGKRKRSGKR